VVWDGVKCFELPVALVNCGSNVEITTSCCKRPEHVNVKCWNMSM
jgi:hypothetical protein